MKIRKLILIIISKEKAALSEQIEELKREREYLKGELEMYEKRTRSMQETIDKYKNEIKQVREECDLAIAESKRQVAIMEEEYLTKEVTNHSFFLRDY